MRPPVSHARRITCQPKSPDSVHDAQWIRGNAIDLVMHRSSHHALNQIQKSISHQQSPESEQDPLRTRHLPFPPRPRRRHTHRHRQRLERALRPMMIVLAPQTVHMQRDARALGEALQAVRQHLGAEVAELLAAQAEVDDGVGPVGEVDDGARESVVEGCVGVAEAGEAGRGVERGFEGAAERDERVFGAVVVVDCRGGDGVLASGVGLELEEAGERRTVEVSSGSQI